MSQALDRADSPTPVPTGRPEPITVRAADGFMLRGFCWRRLATGEAPAPVVVINPATSVRCRYYFRFAAFLFAHGFDVVAYDYRGVGESRPASLRGFDAGWIDWGRLDFEAVLRQVRRAFPDQPIQVVGHSIGGFLVGLAPSNPLIERVFTMGAQFAYPGDYDAARRLGMIARWHLAMPAITAAFGYFPGKALGWLEDTPAGVVRDWAFSRRRFEDVRRGRAGARHPDGPALARQFAAVSAPTLAVSVTDDPFGTVAAVERLLAYFEASPRTHLRIAPADVGASAIGHFAFFHSRFEASLWPLALAWLRAGRLPEGVPGRVVSGGRGG